MEKDFWVPEPQLLLWLLNSLHQCRYQQAKRKRVWSRKPSFCWGCTLYLTKRRGIVLYVQNKDNLPLLLSEPVVITENHKCMPCFCAIFHGNRSASIYIFNEVAPLHIGQLKSETLGTSSRQSWVCRGGPLAWLEKSPALMFQGFRMLFKDSTSASYEAEW